jgi:hypothetical protein
MQLPPHAFHAVGMTDLGPLPQAVIASAKRLLRTPRTDIAQSVIVTITDPVKVAGEGQQCSLTRLGKPTLGSATFIG